MASYTWIGGTGSYSIATNWSPNGPPGPDDTIVIAAGAVTDPAFLSTDGTASALGSIALTGNGTTLTTP